MVPSGDHAVDRRRFLAGVAAGGLALAVPVRVAPAQGGPAALAARELDAFRALVATLGEAPDGRFRAADPGRAARALARWHRRQASEVRRHVAHVLGALASGGVPGYAALARPARPVDDADAVRSAVLAAAVALAGRLLEPGDDAACPPALAVP